MQEQERRRSRGTARSALVGALVGALVASVVAVAAGAPISGTPTVPRIAFVARDDLPFDSLAVGPVAGALGGVTIITPPGVLSAEAQQALQSFAPDVVYIAGGTAAIGPETENQIKAAGSWDVRRVSGTNRDDTARLLAAVLGDLGIGRPVLTGGSQVVGDVRVGGKLTADSLGVQSTAVVQNLNADRLDGVDSAGFAPANADRVVRASSDAAANGSALVSAVNAVKAAGTSGVVLLSAGTFQLSSSLVLDSSLVTVKGAGSRTVITCACSASTLGPSSATVDLSSGALEDVEVRNTGSGSVATGIYYRSTSGAENIAGVDVNLTTSGTAYGIYVVEGGRLEGRDMTVYARSTANAAFAMYVATASTYTSVQASHLTMTAYADTSDATGLYLSGNSASATISNGGNDSIGATSGSSSSLDEMLAIDVVGAHLFLNGSNVYTSGAGSSNAVGTIIRASGSTATMTIDDISASSNDHGVVIAGGTADGLSDFLIEHSYIRSTVELTDGHTALYDTAVTFGISKAGPAELTCAYVAAEFSSGFTSTATNCDNTTNNGAG